MLKNYLKIIFRQFRKDSEFSLINTLGLSIGMAAFLIIAQFVYFHYDFDRYHQDFEEIYRVTTEITRDGKATETSNQSSGILVETVANALPGVQNYARLKGFNYLNASVSVLKNGNKVIFDQANLYTADPTLFDLFDIQFVAGGTDKFSNKSTAVMSASSAARLFDNPAAAIGSSFEIKGNVGNHKYELVGIFEDLPENTHFDFDLLISTASAENYTKNEPSWSSADFYGYLRVSPNTTKESVITEMQKIHDQNAGVRLADMGYDIKYNLVPLAEVHITSSNANDFKSTLDPKIFYALIAISLVILVIAWINYMNLSLVKTINRLKEVGIRKTLGSLPRQINQLFLLEALTLNLIALFISLTLVQLTSPYLKELIGIELNVFAYVELLIGIIILMSLGVLVVGLYPALASSKLSVPSILMSRKKPTIGGLNFRKTMLVFQFSITFLLIATTLVIDRQIKFMKSSDLGFDINQVMVIKAPPGDIQSTDRQDMVSFNAFKTEVMKSSSILSVTNAGEIPGEPISWGTGIRVDGSPEETSVDTKLISMGNGFIEFLDLNLVAGRKFQPGDDPWSRGDVLVNEKMTALLGFEKPEDAIGAKLIGFYSDLIIRGVVENHHHNSLHFDYSPIAFILSSWTEYYFLKLNDLDQSNPNAQLEQSIAMVKQQWDAFYDYPLDYFFLDSYFNRQYQADEQFGSIFSAFSGLAIIIACLGLFGLTSYTLKERTKEIGIRKVLGAGQKHLAVELSRNFVILILVGYCIAMPIAYFIVQNWLDKYTFRISLGSWLFLIPLILVLGLSACTIILKIRKTLVRNPAESLKYE